MYFASHYAPTTIYALTQDGVDISARRDVGCFRDTCYDTYPGYSIYLPSSQEQPGSGGVADCNVGFGVYWGSKVYDLRADGTRGDGTRTGDTWTQAAVIPTGALQDQPIFCQYGGMKVHFFGDPAVVTYIKEYRQRRDTRNVFDEDHSDVFTRDVLAGICA